MATFTKTLLSGSTQGKAIKVASVVTSATITTTSGTTTTYTYNTSAAHGLSSGQIVTITGNTVAAYNLTNATLATASGTTFTISVSGSAPAAGSGGTVVRQDMPAGTTIHSTGTGSTNIDEVWLYAYNGDVAARQLVIQYGGTTYIDNDIKVTVPSQSGLTLIIPGLVLTGTGGGSPTANTISAYASVANVITITGYVNRIS